MEIRSGHAKVGDDLELYYEDLGNPGDPPVLLIMGLGAQLLLWRDGFCERLVEQGYRVIRYDNRDVGLSTKLHGQRPGGALVPNLVRSYLGKPSPSVYTLEHMADDAAALLDHLGIERAHVVGASMGGMIAQIVAAKHRGRTRSLVSIMSSSGDPKLPAARAKASAAMLAPRPDGKDRERVIKHGMKIYRTIGSPGFPTS